MPYGTSAFVTLQMADQESDTLSSLIQEVMNFPAQLRALYYSDDFQTRVCWWFVYTLAVLIVLIHLGWRLYGAEIAKTFMQQGSRPA